MLKSLYTAATGMIAQQLNIDVTSNNLANINTHGYKQSRAEFADLFYDVQEYAGTSTSDTTLAPTGIEVGHGARPLSVRKSFTDGDYIETGNALDIAIHGSGFFQIQLPNGTIAYSRDSAFSKDNAGTLVNASGYPLEPAITVPEGTTEIKVAKNGIVTAKQGNDVSEIGRITLANFVNPAGLSSAGDNLFNSTNASGDPITGNPDDDGFGMLQQGFVEISNVKLVTEMTNLIRGQRAYEANSKSITTSDAMLATVVNVKR